MKGNVTKAIEAIRKIQEGASELTNILMSAGTESNIVTNAFNTSEATDIYPSVFCKSFEELDICTWCDALIKAIGDSANPHKERWMVTSYGGCNEPIVKYFEDGFYDELLAYGKCMKEDYLSVRVSEYNNKTCEYKLAFSL